MIIYAVAFGVLMAAFAGWTFYQRNDAVNDLEAKLAIADMELMAAARQIEADAANHITDMVAAWEQGKEEAEALRPKIKARSDKYVAANPAFADLRCDIGPDFLHLINSATAGMSTATLAGERDATVPVAAAVTRQPDGNSSAGVVGGPQSGGTVGDVHPPAPTVSRPDSVPGPSVRRPKPVPID